MRIRIGHELVFEVPRPTPTLLQHLAITFLRALNIPARYATGYLGDIGVPADPSPMDFSAWLEVYLGKAWHTLDPRHNRPRIGRVLMGRGRDAVDVAPALPSGRSTMISSLRSGAAGRGHPQRRNSSWRKSSRSG